MRLPDNGVRKLGRLDRAEEKSAVRIAWKPTKRPPGVKQDENDRRDRPLQRDSAVPIKYRLSDSHFLKLGWTRLPIAVTKSKIVQYEVTSAKPYLDRFKVYRNRGTEYYDDGLTPFLRYHPDSSGELFYPSGVLAVRIYRSKGRNYDVYTVFTPGGRDTSGKSQILAIFDTMGNGVVLDEDGTTRLSYNQTGGIFTDNPAGLPLVWTWNVNPRKSVLETVYTESSADRLQMKFFPELAKSSGNVTPISPSSTGNKKKKVVEVQKPVVERRQEDARGKCVSSNASQGCCVKIICMKLNEFLSLRIVDRRNIVLRFFARGKSIRIQLGTTVHFDREVAPCVIEARRWRSDTLTCQFQAKLSTELESDNSLRDLAEEYRRVKRHGRKRKVAINKYKSFFPINRSPSTS